MNESIFPKPWRVEVNPFGKSTNGDEDNIFIVDATGGSIAIISKHPVWTYMQKHRLDVANYIVERVNNA